MPGKKARICFETFFLKSYVTKLDFFFPHQITAFSSIHRRRRAQSCVMLGPWEGRPNLVIDKPSRSSVTVSVFWGSVSCLREGGNYFELQLNKTKADV